MGTKVHIPSLMRRLFDTDSVVHVDATTVTEMVHELEKNFPGIGERLIEPDGELRRYVNIFVSQENERVQGDSGTQLEKDAEVWIVPNIAGGRSSLHIATRSQNKFP